MKNKNNGPPILYCDGCERLVHRFWRNHKGLSYCAKCYQRYFVSKPCPSCGSLARLPIFDIYAICRECEKDAPCIRCGKILYKVGKLTPSGPVCNSCSVYFREAKPCPLCGNFSRRLSRSRHLNTNLQICPQCARKALGTCQACRRHRLLKKAGDGRLLCKKCRSLGEVLCPRCLSPMPAGRGNMCENCYWHEILSKKVEFGLAAFASPQLHKMFRHFGCWLEDRVGCHKAALTIHRYLQFFLDIEREWGVVPQYEDLLAHFGPQGLRRYLLPMKLLAEAEYIVIDPQKRNNESERRMIHKKITSFDRGTPARSIIDSYYTELLYSHARNELKLRSVRLALTPACSLLKKMTEAGLTLPTQQILDSYLRKAPGQRAAISRFVRHLQRGWQFTIALPSLRVRHAVPHRVQLRNMLIELLSEEDMQDTTFRFELIYIALEYFHNICCDIDEVVGLSKANEGVIIHLKEESFWLPMFIGRRCL